MRRKGKRLFIEKERSSEEWNCLCLWVFGPATDWGTIAVEAAIRRKSSDSERCSLFGCVKIFVMAGMKFSVLLFIVWIFLLLAIFSRCRRNNDKRVERNRHKPARCDDDDDTWLYLRFSIEGPQSAYVDSINSESSATWQLNDCDRTLMMMMTRANEMCQMIWRVQRVSSANRSLLQ